MFNWIASFWTSNYFNSPPNNEIKNTPILDQGPKTLNNIKDTKVVLDQGPRTLNNIKDIKIVVDQEGSNSSRSENLNLFDQRPKQFIILTATEISSIRTGLKKTQINANRSKFKHPNILIQALDDVFKQGNSKYFEEIRLRREKSDKSEQSDKYNELDDLLEKSDKFNELDKSDKFNELDKSERSNDIIKEITEFDLL